MHHNVWNVTQLCSVSSKSYLPEKNYTRPPNLQQWAIYQLTKSTSSPRLLRERDGAKVLLISILINVCWNGIWGFLVRSDWEVDLDLDLPLVDYTYAPPTLDALRSCPPKRAYVKGVTSLPYCKCARFQSPYMDYLWCDHHPVGREAVIRKLMGTLVHENTLCTPPYSPHFNSDFPLHSRINWRLLLIWIKIFYLDHR